MAAMLGLASFQALHDSCFLLGSLGDEARYPFLELLAACIPDVSPLCSASEAEKLAHHEAWQQPGAAAGGHSSHSTSTGSMSPGRDILHASTNTFNASFEHVGFGCRSNSLKFAEWYQKQRIRDSSLECE